MFLPEIDTIHPDSIVTIGEGVLAYYRLDWGPEAVSSFTLWQGRWSDVYTFDYVTFDQALDDAGRFPHQDAPGGSTIRMPGGWSLLSDSVTIDLGNLVLEVQGRDDVAVPPWPGARGTHVELYRLDSHQPSVWAVGQSAQGVVGRGSGHDPVTDEEVSSMAESLRLEWSER